MHVGLRTTAFGSIEIHTTVVQNQVGLAVHGERGLTHWFSSEVQNIASGLKDHNLNLTAVDLDGGAGIQTATSFQHGQPQRQFAGTAGSGTPEMLVTDELKSDESEPIATILPDQPVGSGPSRVSIRI